MRQSLPRLHDSNDSCIDLVLTVLEDSFLSCFLFLLLFVSCNSRRRRGREEGEETGRRKRGIMNVLVKTTTRGGRGSH